MKRRRRRPWTRFYLLLNQFDNHMDIDVVFTFVADSDSSCSCFELDVLGSSFSISTFAVAVVLIMHIVCSALVSLYSASFALSLYVFGLAWLPAVCEKCGFPLHSFLLVFLDSVSSSWPVFVLLYLSFCVNKGQAWHGSQLCVRKDFYAEARKDD